MSEERWYLRWNENGRYVGDVKKLSSEGIEDWTYEEFTPKECPKPELPNGLYLVTSQKPDYEGAFDHCVVDKKGNFLHEYGSSKKRFITNYRFLRYFGPGEELSPELKRHYGEK